MFILRHPFSLSCFKTKKEGPEFLIEMIIKHVAQVKVWVKKSVPEQEMPDQSLEGWVGIGQEKKDTGQGASDRVPAY